MAMRDEFERAEARGKARRKKYPCAVAARYDSRLGKLVVTLGSGVDIVFAPGAVQGLENASAAQLKKIEISPAGLGLHFPKLDSDVYLPALLDGLLGSKRWAASRLGAAGGSAKSEAKTEAARRNGKLGGRPLKRLSA